MAENLEDLAGEASGLLLAVLSGQVARRGRARIMLAGGSTPRRTYSLLADGIAARGIPPRALDWYFGDERWVPPSDPQSNERMARETLLGPLKAPESSIHSWHAGAGDPVECARSYGDSLRSDLGDDVPDLVLLGVGPDGHTASLFPGSTAWLPDGRKVPVGPRLPAEFEATAIQGGNAKGWRLTLCPAVLGAARYVIFLAAGADKSDAVRKALNCDPATPASWIRGSATAFIITRDAAGEV